MSDAPKDQVTTDEREAIKDELRDEVRAEVVDEVTAELGARTPPPDESSERIRRLSRAESRPLIRSAISAHADHCRDEGPLCSVSKQVDRLRVSSYRQNGALALLTLLGPIVLGIWINSRANDRLSQQLNVAADVARQLKAVQDASKTHGALESTEPPKCQFATGAP